MSAEAGATQPLTLSSVFSTTATSWNYHGGVSKSYNINEATADKASINNESSINYRDCNGKETNHDDITIHQHLINYTLFGLHHERGSLRKFSLRSVITNVYVLPKQGTRILT